MALMVPATLRAVLEHPGWPRADLSSLRGVMAGSSPIPRAYIDAFSRARHSAGAGLRRHRNGTGVGRPAPGQEAMARPGYAGWPQPEVRCGWPGADGTEVADGEVGELLAGRRQPDAGVALAAAGPS
ncbi:hypothetical protein ACU4HD_15960 [Cupriavidus basilensis]